MATELDNTEKRARDEMQRFYTETVVDHALHPRNFGSLAGADGFAGVTSDGGDTMRMWLRVKDDRITETAFWTDACAATIASMSMLTELVTGKAISEALVIGQQDVLEVLGGFFGFLGIGWIYAGRPAMGILLLVSYWLLDWIIGLTLTIGTLGVWCCVWPAQNLIFGAISGYLAHRWLERYS